MRKAVLVLLTSIVVGLVPATVAVSAPPVPLPGAPGIGDPYFKTDGNGGYQVEHYDLRLGYTPATDVLTGTATLRARATQTLSTFNLDLDGLTVQAVRVNGVPARWTRNDDELRIRPANFLRKNRAFVVTVRYAGVPQLVDDLFGESGFFTTNDGALVVGQPHVADTWFPVNDHPLDKATYRIAITAPRALEAVSNGALRSLTTSQGLRTWTWVVNKPMASYLATMAIGEFDLRTYRAGRVDYLDAFDPAIYALPSGGTGGTIGERAEAALDQQPAIVRFLSGVMGRYPFGQAGGIVDNDPQIGFALENQTRPIYDKRFFAGANDGDDDSVVVHELAHQWAGDSLALARWRDIWLNEGFASYAEWLWSEEQGRGTADEIFADYANTIPADDAFWDLKIGNPGAANIFEGAVYDRGAMTLHALRERIGDRDFFRLTKQWFTRYAHGNVTTRQFIDLAERVSGQNLDPFFRTWIYTPTKPAGLENPAARSKAGASSDLAERMTARHAKMHTHR